jgi:hypothetical protein
MRDNPVTEEHLKLREAYVRVLDIDAELQKLLALLKEAVSLLPPQAHLDAQAPQVESRSDVVAVVCDVCGGQWKPGHQCPLTEQLSP